MPDKYEAIAKRFYTERETPHNEPIELLTDFAKHLEKQNGGTMKKTTCNIHKGDHRYQFQQIVQPLYNFGTTEKKPAQVESARLVQACECGHQLVNKV